jgi:predicted permease
MSLLSRFTALFRNRKLDRDLEDELRSHIEMRAEDNVANGMSEEEARLSAARRFGNKALIHEQTRHSRILLWLETVLQDARYGLRALRRSPGFTLIAILTMTLSIGATTAVFTLVESVLLRPLPYWQPERLITIATYMPRGAGEFTGSAEYAAWREQNSTLEDAAAYDAGGFNFSGAGDPDRVQGAWATSNFFSVLGVTPQLGRTFTADEAKRGADGVVVLCHSLWQDRFNSAPDVLGKKVMLDGLPYVVIGVMAKGFRFPDRNIQPEFVVPMALPVFHASINAPMRIVRVVGRTKPSVQLQQALADLQHVSQAVVASFPPGFQSFFRGSSVRVRSLQTEMVGGIQRALLVILAAVAFVLLIGCLNIASLQLARAVQRGPEVGIRSALGAGRGRLLRQLFTENIVLSACGAGGGLVLALAAIKLVRIAKLNVLPSIADIRMDGRVLGVTLLITLGSGLFFSLAPALWVMRSDPTEALGKGTRTSTGTGHRRLRNGLVVAELALALMLLAGAGLMIRSFVRIMNVEVGFNPHDLLTARINLLDSDYPTQEKKLSFAGQLYQRLHALPGAESVTVGDGIPMMAYNGSGGIAIEGRPAPPIGLAPMVPGLGVIPGYFKALQIPLLRGRDFTEADGLTAQPVAIVNESFARKFFPGEDALGKRLTSNPNWGHAPGADPHWNTIVGIIGDVHHVGLDQSTSPEIYRLLGGFNETDLVVAVRAHNAGSLAAALRNEVRAIDPNQPVFRVLTMEQLLSESLAARRLNMLLLGGFALLALVLAAVGIYGVLSYSVAQRSKEIGIRMALGSTQRRVLRLVLNEAVLLSLVGVVIGIGGALALTRFMAGLLYATKPNDPLTLVLGPVVLIAVGFVAGYVPAHRASKVDPMIVLRHE